MKIGIKLHEKLSSLKEKHLSANKSSAVSNTFEDINNKKKSIYLCILYTDSHTDKLYLSRNAQPTVPTYSTHMFIYAIKFISIMILIMLNLLNSRLVMVPLNSSMSTYQKYTSLIS